VFTIPSENDVLGLKSAAGNNADASPQPPHGTHPNSLGAIIQNFKSVSTRKINHASGSPGTKIWQREPYEHIIRGEPELARIRCYIHDNPLHWEQDQQHH